MALTESLYTRKLTRLHGHCMPSYTSPNILDDQFR